MPESSTPTNNMLPSAYYDTVKHPESPQPPNPQFRGLILSGPERAVLTRRQPMIVVHGTYRVSADQYPKPDRLKITAVDLKTKEEFKGRAGQSDPSPMAPPPPRREVDPEKMKRTVVNGFFNTDLVGTVQLPIRSTQYRVWAELGPIRSNEITIDVQIPPP